MFFGVWTVAHIQTFRGFETSGIILNLDELWTKAV